MQPTNNWRAALVGYLLMIAATVAVFFLIRAYGETLSAPAADATAVGEVAKGRAAGAVMHPALHLLVAMAAMIALGRLLEPVCGWLRQPPVIGEILAGIMLGPSLLGQVWPAASGFILPDGVTPALSIVAQSGVVLFMFLVGLELNTTFLRKQGHVTLAISHASIVVPFTLGAALALWLYPILSSREIPFTAFALFLAVSMSITAFPVLARILTDRKLNQTELGTMALACAATDDATAWCLLALVVGVVQAQVNQAVVVVALTVLYLLAMVFIVRPVLARALERYGSSGASAPLTFALLVGMVLSSLATEFIGIHAIFGAFMLGAVIPHHSRVAEELNQKLRPPVARLLLPAFFALSGMRTQIGLVSGPEEWLITLAIIAVATLGKFGGSLAAARIMQLPWRESTALGVLMNTRGLMELIVLNIGLSLGVISPRLFAMMVLMALATTVATSPVLSWLTKREESAARRPLPAEVA